MIETKESPAYLHAEVLAYTEFHDGTGWYGAVQCPEVGRISVWAFAGDSTGYACTIYRFTRDGVEYSATERRYRSLPRGAAIVARNWAKDVLRGLVPTAKEEEARDVRPR